MQFYHLLNSGEINSSFLLPPCLLKMKLNPCTSKLFAEFFSAPCPDAVNDVHQKFQRCAGSGRGYVCSFVGIARQARWVTGNNCLVNIEEVTC